MPRTRKRTAPGGSGSNQSMFNACSIFFITWSMPKLAGFMRGGNSLKVSRKCFTMNCAA